MHNHQSNFLEIVPPPFVSQTGQVEVYFAYTVVLLLSFQYWIFLSAAFSLRRCTYLYGTCAVQLLSVECLIGVSVLHLTIKKKIQNNVILF